ncbi:MAG: gliding motility-associated C-terminal domain-containing protein [Chitinophagales bacterium]
MAAISNPTTLPLTTTTTYTVIGTTSGCTDTAVSTVNVSSSLTISVNSPTICSGQTVQLLASGATNYTWTGGLAAISNPTTLPLTTTTTYTVIGTTSGCTDTAVSTVTVKPKPSVTVNNPFICYNEKASLIASGATSYTWTGGLAAISNPTTLPLTTTTTYTVIGTTSGCTDTAVSTVTVSSSLAISVNSPTICSGQTVQLLASGATNYTWTGGLAAISNPTTLPLTTTTTYTVTGTTSGCTGTAVATVTVGPGLIVSVNSPTICQGNSTQLTATGATSYTWTGGLAAISNPTTPTLTTTTTYTVTGTTNGCTGSDTSTVIIIPNKITNISREICQGENVSIGNQSFSTNGNFSVITQSADGCDSTVTLALTVHPLPVINAISDIILAKFDQQVQLNVSISSPVLSYNWSPVSAVNVDTIKNPTAQIKASTLFTVLVRDNHNCSNSDSILIKMVDDCSNELIYIPSAFSPNNDGVNDCFGIISPPKLTNFRMTIFNRWGETVFNTTNELNCWDGTFKGTSVQSDSYVYIINFTCHNGTDLFKKGSVTVLK